MNYIVAILLGALASFLANRGVAVFNDGLRPIVPEFLEGRMDRKSLAATSFAQAKYVFYFIGDGMGAGQRQITEEFKKGVLKKDGKLLLNSLPFAGITQTMDI